MHWSIVSMIIDSNNIQYLSNFINSSMLNLFQSKGLLSITLFLFGSFAKTLLTNTLHINSLLLYKKPYRMNTNKSIAIETINSNNYQSIHEESLSFYNKLINCDNESLNIIIKQALSILNDALRLYGPKRVISSFNGGKDAVVVMHLLRAAMANYINANNISLPDKRPQFVYFAIQDEFPEVLEYIQQCEDIYSLNIKRYDCGIIQGLEEHVNSLSKDSNDNYPSLAFVLGTRQGDSNADGQDAFSPASSWMPVPFMRVNPILKWSYGQVWDFLRAFDLPYCKLYDEGYTSLGKRSDTQPNPYLRRKTINLTTNSTESSYWPAYMLVDWSKERAGRIKRNAKTNEIIEKVESLKSDSTDIVIAKTAGMIVIGDEILNGSITEMNIQLAAKLLGEIGIEMKRVSIIGDCIHDIADEVRKFSQLYDVVITSGGVGPTHDDVTMKGVAAAFKQDITIHKEMLNHVKEMHYLSTPMNSPNITNNTINDEEHINRLSKLPSNAVLRFPPTNDITDSVSSSIDTPIKRQVTKVWPIVQVENVFILPGIPKYFATKIPIIIKHFIRSQGPVTINKRIVLRVEEREILSILDETVNRFQSIKFGSYPFVDQPNYKTIITIEGKEDALVKEAFDYLLAHLSNDSILSVADP